MTTSDYKKAFTQLKNNPVKMAKYIKHNTPKKRNCGLDRMPCKYCGRKGGHVGQYGIGFCRQCFRDYAQDIGFKKYS